MSYKIYLSYPTIPRSSLNFHAKLKMNGILYIIIIIIYHDFLPPLRRGSHGKSNNIHTHAHTCTHMHTHAHTYTHIHIHTHTRTYTHIHTPMHA